MPNNLRNYQLSGVLSRSRGSYCEDCIRSVYSTLPSVTERKTKSTRKWRREHDYEINNLMHLTLEQYRNHILTYHRTNNKQRQQRAINERLFVSESINSVVGMSGPNMTTASAKRTLLRSYLSIS